MNIKKKSIIIPAFALLIGASLAGSISGTVAWYQYSTRVNTAYVGVSGGTSGNLQIRIGEDGVWSTRLTKESISSFIANDSKNPNKFGRNVLPITSGAMDKEDALPANFYLNPIYGQEGGYANWQKADKGNYVVLPLQLRHVERDGTKDAGVDAKNIAKEVFLTDLYLEEDKANADANNPKEDLSDAIRFHIDAFKEEDRNVPANHINRLISKNGGTTVTNGKLDLDGDSVPDYKYNSDQYGFGSDETTPLIYGEGSQVSFSNEVETRAGSYYTADGQDGADANVYGMVVESVGDSLDIKDSTKEYEAGKSKSIGSTLESETEFLNVVVTIWVEGWQTFENANHEHVSIWDSDDFIGSSFDVGFQFAVDPVE